MDQNGFLTCVESMGDSCKCELFPKHDNQDCVESVASKLDARTADSGKGRAIQSNSFPWIVIQLDNKCVGTSVKKSALNTIFSYAQQKKVNQVYNLNRQFLNPALLPGTTENTKSMYQKTVAFCRKKN